jgi:hypothetical protein
MDVRYLPGGAAVLPLLGQDTRKGLLGDSGDSDDELPSVRSLLAQMPSLAVVFAAQAEDVQQWLEQVQPLNQTPVIAVASAGADPLLRPYQDSGQLAGLVSGFDGAYAYAHLLRRPLSPEEQQAAERHVAFQNWGHFAALAAILLGNLSALLGRNMRNV